jgi:hypothetical protein
MAGFDVIVFVSKPVAAVDASDAVELRGLPSWRAKKISAGM